MPDSPAADYDAVLIVSFGGPEGPDDVLPFLENVLAGKHVPRERMLAVAEHYQHFGGVSPLNAHNRALQQALQAELTEHGPKLPVYWGNRNWHPLLTETLAEMHRDGIRRALGFFTTGYSSYSSCRQYREDIQKAQAPLGASAPHIDKLRAFYNHPVFVELWTECVRDAWQQIPPERRERAKLVFTAHSIPNAMADNCRYAAQLAETGRLISEALSIDEPILCYQSRSGPPTQPWLEPDVCDVLRSLSTQGTSDVVIAPIGFLSDHIEILWDLDTEARSVAEELGLKMLRTATVGAHPRFVGMIRELILERVSAAPRRALGAFGPSHDVCPADCCLYTPQRPSQR